MVALTCTTPRSAISLRTSAACLGVIENESSGVLPLVNAHPLSPQALIHCRPSSRPGFSVKPLTAPTAPALTSAHLKSAGFLLVRTSFPLRDILAIFAG